MSGALGVLATAKNATRFDVTAANLAGAVGLYGYNPGAAAPTGSISATAFRTTTINNVTSRAPAAGSPYDLGIVLDGSLAQSFFSSLVVQGDSGIRYYHTSTASYLVFGGGTLTSWQWGSSDPVWTSAATRFLLLQY